jgi:hypothetical protein
MLGRDREGGAIVNRLGVYALAGALLFSPSMKAQRITDKTLDITVQVLDGRNGKPLADQHVLVFTGLSADAVKTHAQHTGVTTGKDGVGTLTIYPGETQWLQVFTDGHVPCFPDPNKASFSVGEIMSKGLVTPNDCSAQVQQASPGHFVIYARPAHFMEKMKQ